MIGRHDGPVDEAGCFAFTLVISFVISFNFGIEECMLGVLGVRMA